MGDRKRRRCRNRWTNSGVQYEIMQIDGKGLGEQQAKPMQKEKSHGRCTRRYLSCKRSIHCRRIYLGSDTSICNRKKWTGCRIKILNSKFLSDYHQIDQQTGEVITDPATFKVEQVDLAVTQPQSQQKMRLLHWENVPVGTYKITEVTAPEGYALGDCPRPYTLAKDKNVPGGYEEPEETCALPIW